MSEELSYFNNKETDLNDTFTVVAIKELHLGATAITTGMVPISTGVLTVGPFTITAGMCPITINQYGFTSTATRVRGLASVEEAIASLQSNNDVKQAFVHTRDRLMDLLK